MCSFTCYKWFSWQYSGYGDIRLGLYCVGLNLAAVVNSIKPFYSLYRPNSL